MKELLAQYNSFEHWINPSKDGELEYDIAKSYLDDDVKRSMEYLILSANLGHCLSLGLLSLINNPWYRGDDEWQKKCRCLVEHKSEAEQLKDSIHYNILAHKNGSKVATFGLYLTLSELTTRYSSVIVDKMKLTLDEIVAGELKWLTISMKEKYCCAIYFMSENYRNGYHTIAQDTTKADKLLDNALSLNCRHAFRYSIDAEIRRSDDLVDGKKLLNLLARAVDIECDEHENLQIIGRIYLYGDYDMDRCLYRAYIANVDPENWSMSLVNEEMDYMNVDIEWWKKVLKWLIELNLSAADLGRVVKQDDYDNYWKVSSSRYFLDDDFRQMVLYINRVCKYDWEVRASWIVVVCLLMIVFSRCVVILSRLTRLADLRMQMLSECTTSCKR